MSEQISKLRVYSLGIVAVNKPLSSMDIEVTPIEDVPMLNGELTDNVQDVTSKAKDTEGAAYHTAVPAASSIKATWLPLEGGGNRLTAPDVRRGERVVIYRFADTDQFWWVTQGQDMRLRKLETVIWGISATKDESADPNPDNMYWMEWSSHKKAITIHTSKADGEPYAYDIQIDTAYGSILIQDDAGNSFSLDSPERIWKIINGDGAYVEVNKREITEYAPDKITLKTKDLVLEVDNDMSTTVGHNVTKTVGGSETVTVSGAVQNTAPTTTIVSETTLDGAVTMTQTMNVHGEARGGTGGAAGGGVSLTQHRHPENDHGGPTDPPLAE